MSYRMLILLALCWAVFSLAVCEAMNSSTVTLPGELTPMDFPMADE